MDVIEVAGVRGVMGAMVYLCVRRRTATLALKVHTMHASTRAAGDV